MPIKREVDTILDGLFRAEKSCRTRDKYAQEARYPPRIAVHFTSACPLRGITPKPNDIVFTEADAN